MGWRPLVYRGPGDGSTISTNVKRLCKRPEDLIGFFTLASVAGVRRHVVFGPRSADRNHRVAWPDPAEANRLLLGLPRCNPTCKNIDALLGLGATPGSLSEVELTRFDQSPTPSTSAVTGRAKRTTEGFHTQLRLLRRAEGSGLGSLVGVKAVTSIGAGQKHGLQGQKKVSDNSRPSLY